MKIDPPTLALMTALAYLALAGEMIRRDEETGT